MGQRPVAWTHALFWHGAGLFAVALWRQWSGCSARLSAESTRADADVVPGAGLEPARGFPQGIFVPLQLSLLHARSTCICGLDFTFAIPHALAPRRIRQGPSSLYTFSGEAASGGRLTSA